jgi:hypothetical protein
LAKKEVLLYPGELRYKLLLDQGQNVLPAKKLATKSGTLKLLWDTSVWKTGMKPRRNKI